MSVVDIAGPGHGAQRGAPRTARRPVLPVVVAVVSVAVGAAVGAVVAAVVATFVADVNTRPPIDPELATLLRGMAALKALVVVAATAAVAWRLRHPIAPRATFGYVGAIAAMAAAAVLVWQATALVPAALAFHGGLLALLVTAWRVDDAAPLAGSRR